MNAAKYVRNEQGQTELMILSSHNRPQQPITSASVCEIIGPKTFAKNIGVTLDPIISMENQINATCRSAFLHLRNLSRIRK